MFHTYVQRRAAGPVDFDRASFLMDKDLLDDVLQNRDEALKNIAVGSNEYGAQWVWDEYCRWHEDQYGEPFKPDVNPDWA